MGSGAEDKAVLALGQARVGARLAPSGTTQPLPLSSCAFASYKVATMLSSPGPEGTDGDVEISACISDRAWHGNPPASLSLEQREELEQRANGWENEAVRRGAFVRSMDAIFPGGVSLCDHRVRE